jgi:hypothetical protein
LTTEQNFPVLETNIINGEEYITLHHEVFQAFFNAIMAYTDVAESEMIRKINNEYNRSLKIKRRRIKNKKLKSILLVMYGLIENVSAYNGDKKEDKVQAK